MALFLLRILLLVSVLWLLRRFLAAIMGTLKQSRPRSSTAEAANYMVKDPVCGMYMDSRLALRLDNRNEVFYFCSEECKKKYLNKSAGERIDPAATR